MMNFGMKWYIIIMIAIGSSCLLIADPQFFHLVALDPYITLLVSTFLMVVIIEAIVFYRLGWTWKNSAIDSLLLNLVSTVVSTLFCALVTVGVLQLLNVFYPSLLMGTFNLLSYVAFFAIIIILEFLLSVIIEFYTLILVRGRENIAKFRLAVIANNLLTLPVMMLSWIKGIIYVIASSIAIDLH
jgi:hypothetical protein